MSIDARDSTTMTFRFFRPFVPLSLFLIAACGGGGGGGSTPPPPTGGGPTNPPPDRPIEFSAPLVVTPENASAVGQQSSKALTVANLLALFAANQVVIYKGAEQDPLVDTSAGFQTSCDFGGLASFMLEDIAGEAGLDAGDRLVVTLSDGCATNEFFDGIDGVVTIEVDELQVFRDRSYLVRGRATYGQPANASPAGTGSLVVGVTDIESSFPAVALVESGLRFDATLSSTDVAAHLFQLQDGVTSTLTFESDGATPYDVTFDSLRVLRRRFNVFDFELEYFLEANWSWATQSLGGAIVCSTGGRLRGSQGEFPTQGELSCTGSGQSGILVTSAPSGMSEVVLTATDTTGAETEIETFGDTGTWAGYARPGLIGSRLRDALPFRTAAIDLFPRAPAVRIESRAWDREFVPDSGQTVFVDDDSIWVIDGATGAELARDDFVATKRSVSVTSDGTHAWVMVGSEFRASKRRLPDLIEVASVDTSIDSSNPSLATTVFVSPIDNDLIVVHYIDEFLLVAYQDGVALPGTYRARNPIGFAGNGEFISSATSGTGQSGTAVLTIDPVSGVLEDRVYEAITFTTSMRLVDDTTIQRFTRLYDMTTGLEIPTVRLTIDSFINGESVGFVDNGGSLIATSANDSFNVLDPVTRAWRAAYALQVPISPAGQEFSSDSDNYYILDFDGIVRIAKSDVPDNRSQSDCAVSDFTILHSDLSQRTVNCDIVSAEIDRDARRLYVGIHPNAGTDGNAIFVLDLDTFVVVDRLNVGGLPVDLELTEDRTRLLAMLETSSDLLVIDTASLQIIERRTLRYSAVSAVAPGEGYPVVGRVRLLDNDLSRLYFEVPRNGPVLVEGNEVFEPQFTSTEVSSVFVDPDASALLHGVGPDFATFELAANSIQLVAENRSLNASTQESILVGREILDSLGRFASIDTGERSRECALGDLPRFDSGVALASDGTSAFFYDAESVLIQTFRFWGCDISTAAGDRLFQTMRVGGREDFPTNNYFFNVDDRRVLIIREGVLTEVTLPE